MKLTEITLYENKSHRILKEGWQDLTESQKLYQGRFEKELWPLVEQYTKLAEAELSRQQVLDIFSGAEQVAMDGGDNKTIAGKVGAGAAAAAKLPVDLAKKVDAKINQLGKLAKNAGPVKNADAKFAQLKKDITANNSDSKIVQGVQKISDWAKENPGKASLAVGILTTMAAFAGGPAGGAAAGLILRASKELLQGEDLSSAIGKSVKTAAYGAIAGWALNGIGDWFEGLRFDSVPYEKAPGLVKFDVGFTETFTAPGITMEETIGSMVIPESEVGRFTDLLNTMKEATASGATSNPAALNAFSEMSEFVDTFDAQWWLDSNKVANDLAQAIAAENDAFLQNMTAINNGISALAQGTASGKIDAKDVKVGGEPVQGELDLKGGSDATPVDKNFDKSQKLSDFGKVGETMSMEERFQLYLAEADPAQGELPLDNPNTMGAKLKRGAGKLAGKAAGAVKGAASSAAGAVKQGAKDVGNKVTANKLTKTWKSMGEPTDAGSIANILADAGVSNDQIAQISKTANVKLQPTPKSTAADPKAAAKATAKDPKAAAEPKSAISKGANKATATKPMKKGTTKEVGGKTYRWEGALWVDTATNKPVSVANAMKMGLGNPKLDPIISAAKKDPALAKLIKQQITSKGVKAGTAQAAKAAQPDAKNKVAPKAAPAASVAPKAAAPTANVAPKAAATKKAAAKAAPVANVATGKSDSKLKKTYNAVKGGYKNYNNLGALNPGS
jgi:hypothetical protein